jgi:LemA protein
MMSYIILIGIGVVAIGLFSYTYKTYNAFIKLKLDVERQLSHIQAHLKKKFDLIPGLAEVVKGYSKHEKGTFEEVTKLRSQWGAAKDLDAKIKTSNMLESALSKLLIVQEQYPKLKADRSFLKIQKSIEYVEKELLRERKLYNKRVSWYNMQVQQFPSNIIALLFGFKNKEFFAIEE